MTDSTRPPPPRPRHRLGFDIGGTFTDLALEGPAGQFVIHKVLTTPDDPARGALEGIKTFLGRERVSHSDLTQVVHATTLVANTLIQGNGAAVGLITTRGFRDVLETGNEQRYDIYDLSLRFPTPLSPRHLRRGIAERTDRDGRVLKPVDAHEIREVLHDFKAQGVQAVAVCLLHSYRNPHNERAVADIIAEAWPEVPVSLSNDVAPEIREYERTSTTVANTYVQPLVASYLGRLKGQLQQDGFSGPFYTMASSGSVSPISAAIVQPIRMLESGPAAGAILAAQVGLSVGRPNVLSFDMGGTTAKLCLITEGHPALSSTLEAARIRRFKKGSGYPIRMPTVDLLEIGAGGGSIAWMDTLGLLKVGPQSAGASPGPAAYGFGGTDPTVTDADLVLGYLDPGYFLAGEMPLDLDAAARAITDLAGRLGMEPMETAEGIHRVVNENMASAARIHVIEKAQDPRRFALVCFGGAGPVHAAEVGRIVGSPEIIVPIRAGVASAVGLLLAPLAFDFVRSFPVRLDAFNWQEAEALLESMEQEGQAFLREARVDGQAICERHVDGRFAGQLHEISLPLPPDVGAMDSEAFVRSFRSEYLHLFRHLPGEMPIELLTWRVRVEAPEEPSAKPSGVLQSIDASPARKGERQAFFGEIGGFLPALVYDRYLLEPGMQLEGPALVEERESTLVVRPGMRAFVDGQRNVRMSWD